MKLIAPAYYKKFHCIAEKCRHNCCLGWEIDIDADTLDKYSQLGGEIGKEIRESISYEPQPHFELCEIERCPHLDKRGLCRIIAELGEGMLCDICREHPRFYNDCGDHSEVGLGLACEEACRIILMSDEYNLFEQIGEIAGEDGERFASIDFRCQVYSILKGLSDTYEKKLKAIYEKFKISPAVLDAEQWEKLIKRLEYMDRSHRDMFLNFSVDIKTPKRIEKTAERALAYFVYRHCSSAYSYDEYRASLGFCLFLERLFVSISVFCGFQNTDEIARTISEEIEYSEENTETIKNEIFEALELFDQEKKC